jgi:hypothetical protein
MVPAKQRLHADAYLTFFIQAYTKANANPGLAFLFLNVTG